MCGRYTSTAAFDELALRFGIAIEAGTNEELSAHYSVAPSQEVPIITASGKGRRPVMATWGFRPAWVKDGKLAPINARAETVATSRLFGWSVREGRCIIPATGFYEWKPVPGQKRKQPYHVRLKGGALFGFAGLWTPGLTLDKPPTCAIITTTANELLAPIHGRMPVILDPDDEALWLDPGPVAPVKLLPCLRPLASDLLEVYPVSMLVSSPENEGSELLEPVTVEGGPSTGTVSDASSWAAGSQ
jgi:putative SOS response-associated peptidase YedK